MLRQAHDVLASMAGRMDKERSVEMKAKALVLTMAMLGVMITTVGCNNSAPYAIELDTVTREAYPRQVVLDESLHDYIVAQRTVITPSEPGRPMQVSAALRNISDGPIKVQYKIDFYDERGRLLEGASGWQNAYMAPKARVIMEANSISDRAMDWSMEIRPAR